MSPAPRSEQRVVVVGAGHGGIAVAEALRERGHRGPVTVVGDEPVPPYQRPPLSKEHLAAATPPRPLPLRSTGHLAERRITLRTGVPVTGLDRTARTVRLADGRVLGYDALVLATGSVNRTLRVPGTELGGIHGLRTLADADALWTGLERCRSLVVVGAGFVGLEVAAAARARDLPVTVLEAAARPLSRTASPEVAAHVAQVHRRAGTVLHTGGSVLRFTGAGGRVTGVVGTGGHRYRADLVLVGVGAVPRTELAGQAGLPVDDGVLVDDRLRTADPAVYAVGDCARTGRLRLESVQNATDQARRVAAAVLGEDPGPAGPAWFWSRQGELTLQIAGVPVPGDERIVLGEPDTGRFSVGHLRAGRLAAVESVNQPAVHVAARRVLAADPPRAAELRAPGFDLREHARRDPAGIGRTGGTT